MSGETVTKKRGFDLNPFFILFLVIIAVYVASFIVEPGAYERQLVNGRTLVIPGSYHPVDKAAVSWLDVFRSLPNGLIGSSSIVFLILIIGGAIEIFNKTGTISAGVGKLVSYSKEHEGSSLIMLGVLYAFFAVLGGFLGFAENAIPFVPLVVPLVLALGYDAMTAVGVVFLGCLVGFAVGPTNVYTVGVAHGVAELPMFSGFEFRFVAYVVFCLAGMLHLLLYARRVHKDPSRSYMAGIDDSDLRVNYTGEGTQKLEGAHICSLIVLLASFVVTIFGMRQWNWGINDMSAVFFVAGILAGILGRVPIDDFVSTFLTGAKGAMGGAMVVGVARGIQWMLDKTALLDPTINTLAVYLEGLSPFGSAVAVFVVILFMDGIISSGSGKAMAVMPIIIPLCDMVGVTRQTATLAYQFGDGIANMGWFTFGTLYIFLSYGKIPLGKWYRFFWPLMVVMFILSIIFLYIAVQIGY
ncbi:MAG: TRAP transporter large permease subunit [Synergistaceae bacterium]|jgi:uncharacterized ion transporter superfamily protein YfcC|nr:TRAP transporter large permease subunit [Synergistaceae bacterium]